MGDESGPYSRNGKKEQTSETAGLVRRELHSVPVVTAVNSAWECGMGSSLRVAVETLATVTEGEIDGAVITLCDQPLVTANAIDRLVRMHYETGKDVVASEYADTHGVPAFISRRLFDEVAALNGNDGAKRLIARHPQGVATVPLIEAAFDVDTPEDYEKLKSAILFETVDFGTRIAFPALEKLPSCTTRTNMETPFKSI